MSYRIEDLQNDPAWTPSLGEKLEKIHFRNCHYHAECDPESGFCEIDYDLADPHESLESLLKHMWESKLGRAVLVVGAVTVLDQIFNDGKIVKSILRLIN